MKQQLIILTMFIIGVAFCLSESGKAQPNIANELPAHEKSIAESSNKFGFKLFQKIIKQDADKNIFMSPMSISMALAMVYNGAEGETKKEMAKTLEMADLTIDEMNDSYHSLITMFANLDPEVTFQIANSIWYRQGFDVEPDFIELNSTCFNAQVNALNFNDPAAVDIINGWVSENTNDKIKEIVSRPIPPDMVMYLINAIYFLGNWTDQFNTASTKDDKFTLLDGSQTDCRMMFQDRRFSYLENDEFQAVNLPYGNKDFSMSVILPKPDINIDGLIDSLNQDSWQEWRNSFTFRPNKIKLYLPKFKLEYEIELSDILTALGMGDAFSPSADFTGINKSGEVFISFVKHKTFVKVDEEGTEAAAVTSVGMMTSAMPMESIVMRVDRPFIFIITEDQSQSVVFIGKIIEPVWE
ncbi:MAG: serpin family protein [candidate division Zixibacteria bacterium]|nr:serpin family protein [candidate division Zixibacteria bacterium]